jgi:hypothetical protein
MLEQDVHCQTMPRLAPFVAAIWHAGVFFALIS